MNEALCALISELARLLGLACQRMYAVAKYFPTVDLPIQRYQNKVIQRASGVIC